MDTSPTLRSRGGTLVNHRVGGRAGGRAAASGYAGAKHPVVGLTTKSAVEYARKDIRGQAHGMARCLDPEASPRYETCSAW